MDTETGSSLQQLSPTGQQANTTEEFFQLMGEAKITSVPLYDKSHTSGYSPILLKAFRLLPKSKLSLSNFLWAIDAAYHENQASYEGDEIPLGERLEPDQLASLHQQIAPDSGPWEEYPLLDDEPVSISHQCKETIKLASTLRDMDARIFDDILTRPREPEEFPTDTVHFLKAFFLLQWENLKLVAFLENSGFDRSTVDSIYLKRFRSMNRSVTWISELEVSHGANPIVDRLFKRPGSWRELLAYKKLKGITTSSLLALAERRKIDHSRTIAKMIADERWEEVEIYSTLFGIEISPSSIP